MPHHGLQPFLPFNLDWAINPLVFLKAEQQYATLVVNVE
jgi:hypothetical protein